MSNKEKIINILIERGGDLLKQPYKLNTFTKNPEADKLLNNLENYPHLFVLACVMDRQINSERAWLIPYKVSKEISSYEFSTFLELSQNQIKEIFNNKKLHRFNDLMAENFYLAIQKIHNNYRDNASNIWKDNPKSATIIRRFLEFKGIGVKIATMATNILAREFKIPMQDHLCIDISPDVHVKRVFKRLGFISKDASNEELIYCARELHPKYPGIFDLSCFEIGKKWCNPKNPKCSECYLNDDCIKII